MRQASLFKNCLIPHHSFSPRYPGLVVFACAVICAAYLLWGELSRDISTPEFQYIPIPKRGLAYYNQLADGFASGHLYLKLPPPSGLIKLANPYDPVANLQYRLGDVFTTVGQLQDVSYFKEKLYLYFSPVAALVVFLPFKILFGIHLAHQEACAIFCLIGFIAQARLLYKTGRTFFPEVKNEILVFCMFGLGVINLAPLILRRPEVWEVPICTAYAFSSLMFLTFYDWWQSDGPGVLRLVLISVFCGLAVGSRPTEIGILLVLVVTAAKILRSGPRNIVKVKTCSTALLALVAPVALIGVSLLLYNYERFGKMLEFGMTYQLLGDDAGKIVKWRASFFWFNLRVYFTQTFLYYRDFPFVRPGIPNDFPAGHFGVESVVGLLPTVPIIGSSFAAFCRKTIPTTSREPVFRVLTWTMLAVNGLILGVLCLFGGVCVRYELEFGPLFAFLAMVGVFSLEERWGNSRASVFIRATWSTALIVSVLFVGLERNNPLYFVRPEWSEIYKQMP